MNKKIFSFLGLALISSTTFASPALNLKCDGSVSKLINFDGAVEYRDTQFTTYYESLDGTQKTGVANKLSEDAISKLKVQTTEDGGQYYVTEGGNRVVTGFAWFKAPSSQPANAVELTYLFPNNEDPKESLKTGVYLVLRSETNFKSDSLFILATLFEAGKPVMNSSSFYYQKFADERIKFNVYSTAYAKAFAKNPESVDSDKNQELFYKLPIDQSFSFSLSCNATDF